MFAIMNDGHILVAMDHQMEDDPKNEKIIEELEPYLTQYPDAILISMPERTMEDIVQCVVRPKLLLDRIYEGRDEALVLSEAGTKYMEMISTRLAMVRYHYDLNFKFQDVEHTEEMIEFTKNLDFWETVKINTLILLTDDELIENWKEIYNESLKWDYLIDKLRLETGYPAEVLENALLA